MKQIFILGASSVYGVGAEHGWGDLVKSYVHSKMYSSGGVGEKYEVFNFSKSASTIEFVAETTQWIFDHYARSKEVVVLISVGGNDAKAVSRANNFVCTPEEFEVKITNLITVLQNHSKHVIFISNWYVDESKVNPKINPFDVDRPSYFTNDRRFQFNDITKKVCEAKGFSFVTPRIEKDEWIKNYLYEDGIHPNQAGYQKIFEALKPILDKTL